MVPFYVYYSMFGFQRIGDLAWAAGDMQARGFLLGGTSGRTTLNGEGLQHEDGHSHILAGTIPNCVSYDPTFAHEVGVILHHGLKRMVEKQDNVFYYLTLLNENYPLPGLQARHRRADHQGHVPAARRPGGKRNGESDRACNCSAAARSCAKRSPRRTARKRLGRRRRRLELPELQRAARDGQDAERWNLLHPTEKPRMPFVAQQLEKTAGPVVASTDYMKPMPSRSAPSFRRAATTRCWAPTASAAATSAAKLREHFEVNRHYIVVAALKALAEEGTVPAAKVAEAIKKYGINADKINPLYAYSNRRDGTTNVEVKVPDIGDFKEVEVIEVLVKPGDTVKAEQSLITVESDKASMEIPSTPAGVVKELKVKLGDKVKEGSPLLVLEGEAQAAPAANAAAPAAGAPCRAAPPAAAAPAPAAPAPAASAAASQRPIEVTVPDIGDFKDVAVIEVLVKPGDTVQASRR